MITIDAPISFVVGAGIAVLAQRFERGNSQDTSEIGMQHAFWRGLVVQAVLLTPLILFFMVRFPDWEWNYMFDARTFFFTPNQSVGVLVFVAAMAAMNLSYVLGFRLAESSLRQGNAQRVYKMLAAVGLLVLLIMAFFWRETLHVGSYADFNSGAAKPMYQNIPFMMTMVVSGPMLAAGLYWALLPNITNYRQRR